MPNKTTLYLDCEYNGFGGELISLALVAAVGIASADGSNAPEFYQVLACENPDPWVAENVLPVLYAAPVSFETLQAELEAFLEQFEAVHIIADWPEDIALFCLSLLTGPGMRLSTPPLTMEVLRIDAPSTVPHNALEDARGIRNYIATQAALR